MTARLLRWLRLFLAAVATLALAAQIVVAQLAARAVDAGSESLARIAGPASADAQTLIAAHSLNRGDADGAISSATGALRMAPVQTGALPILAGAQAMQGRLLLAAQLMDLSARSGWRDPATQWWVLQLAVHARSFDVAAQRADALLRQRQFELPAAALLRQVEMAGGRRALAQRLAETPTWKSFYLTNVAGLAPAQLSARGELLHDILALGGTLEEAEIAAPVNALLAASRPSEARDLWVGLTGSRDRDSSVSDGSFERLGRREGSPPLVPFEWKLSDLIDADVEVVPRPGGSGGAAVHVTADAGAAGTALEQVLTLSSGAYLLSFSSAAESGGFPASWNLICADDRTLEQKRVRQGRESWAKEVYAFAVPAGCSSQRLRLRLTGRNMGRSEFWLDDVSIEPAGDR